MVRPKLPPEERKSASQSMRDYRGGQKDQWGEEVYLAGEAARKRHSNAAVWANLTEQDRKDRREVNRLKTAASRARAKERKAAAAAGAPPPAPPPPPPAVPVPAPRTSTATTTSATAATTGSASASASTATTASASASTTTTTTSCRHPAAAGQRCTAEDVRQDTSQVASRCGAEAQREALPVPPGSPEVLCGGGHLVIVIVLRLRRRRGGPGVRPAAAGGDWEDWKSKF